MTTDVRRRITLDPRCKFVYASFYIQGLRELFGPGQVRFGGGPFQDLKQKSPRWDFDHYMAFHIAPEDLRIVIDYGDKNEVSESAVAWSDIYAKINLKTGWRNDATAEMQKKILPVGPGFGINDYPRHSLYALCLRNRLKSLLLPGRSPFREFLSGYNWARIRRPENEYRPAASSGDFVFHASSFYGSKQAHGEETNDMRRRFIETVKRQPGVQFEGGLFRAPADSSEYADVAATRYYSGDEYLEMTARSALVFNTPAAWGCHGWKLGEYFALGKAILSTNFANDPPPGVKHGENIHLVSSPGDIELAAKKILDDRDYRSHLEANAHKLYREKLAPAKVVQEIISFSGLSSQAEASSAAG